MEAAPAPQKAINAASQQPAPAAQQPTNPFTALDSSPILAQLFVKYPQLLSQLKEIYAATQPPPGEEHKMLPGGLPWAVGGSGSRGKRRWDRDEGMRKGREALAKARSLPGPEGEGVREFAELVKMLISSSGRAAEGPSATGIGGVGEHAATDAELRIRQELVEQDVELVKHLMAAENS